MTFTIYLIPVAINHRVCFFFASCCPAFWHSAALLNRIFVNVVNSVLVSLLASWTVVASVSGQQLILLITFRDINYLKTGNHYAGYGDYDNYGYSIWTMDTEDLMTKDTRRIRRLSIRQRLSRNIWLVVELFNNKSMTIQILNPLYSSRKFQKKRIFHEIKIFSIICFCLVSILRLPVFDKENFKNVLEFG